MAPGDVIPGSPVVRDATTHDRAAVLGLNNAAVPHVNALTPDELDWLAREADYFRVAIRDDVMVGFVIAIRHGTAYWSRNYAWFGERFDAFLYLDRVVVAPATRRTGVGATLYADVERFARGRWPRVTLEVNIEPPNPGSMAFHEVLGFREVGTRIHASGAVRMLQLTLTAVSERPA